jgi:hypothetical protein
VFALLIRNWWSSVISVATSRTARDRAPTQVTQPERALLARGIAVAGAAQALFDPVDVPGPRTAHDGEEVCAGQTPYFAV